MKKTRILIISILLLLLLSAKGYSQTSPVRLGLKISPNIAWMNPDEKNYSYNGVAAGVSFGFVSEFNMTEHYAILTGFNFSFLGGNLTLPYAEKPDTGTLQRNYNFRYLEVPLMIKMKTREFGKFTLFGQIGFGTGFNLKTKVNDSFNTTLHGTIDNNKQNLSTDQTSLVREAVLVGIGSEYKVDESVALVVSLGYSNSLNSVLEGHNPKDPGLKNRSSLNYAELNIGVLF